MRLRNNRGRQPDARRKGKSAYRRGEKIVIFFKKGIMVMTVVIVIAAAILAAKLLLGAFPVRNIMVSGNYHLEESEIKGAVGNSYGMNLLRLSFYDLDARLKKKAWVKKAVFRKQMPDTLMINIEESAPKALLGLNGSMFLVDADGNVLEELEDRSTPFLPVIMEIDPKKDRGGILEALKLIDGLNEKDFLAHKDPVEIMLKSYGLEAKIDGVCVRVGFGGYSEKLGRWKDLAEEIRKEDVKLDYVDLRYEDEVVVKPLKKSEEKTEVKSKEKTEEKTKKKSEKKI